MNRQRMGAWVLGIALLAPIAAYAQTAYTNRDVAMRAGPNTEFPLVASVPGGVPVQVNGCVAGYTWCDVNAGPDRGWVYADFLSYPYRNQPVTVISAGALIGFPIVTFAVGPYWNSYYVNRPWYGNRAYWYGRPANWWYAPAPRYAQPVVRTYPQYHGNDHRYVNNGHPNNAPVHRDGTPNRPPGVMPPPVGHDRTTTHENDRTSPSARTYSQQ